MRIKPEHEERLEGTLIDAEFDYWANIAKRFPEAKTGDFPPDLTAFREQHNREDVLWWLRFNAPELLVEE